eukprot:1918881-Rhodomonas_salina.4
MLANPAAVAVAVAAAAACKKEADTGHPAEVEGIEVGSEVEFGCWRLSVQVRRVRACVKMLYLRRRVFA